MFKPCLHIFILAFWSSVGLAQTDSLTRFYYPDGTLSRKEPVRAELVSSSSAGTGSST